MEQCRRLTFSKENWWTASSLSEETQRWKIQFASLSHPLVCLHLLNYLKINTYQQRNDQFLSFICIEICRQMFYDFTLKPPEQWPNHLHQDNTTIFEEHISRTFPKLWQEYKMNATGNRIQFVKPWIIV